MLPPDLIILMYHHVAEPPPGTVLPGLYVTPGQFAWQMDWLQKKGVRFCTFASLARGVPDQADGSPWVMLTFDDGFRDVYENAWPILKERDLGAVMYPVVGDIGKSGVVWEQNHDKTPVTLMTEGQIREMAQGGCEFGSHLWDHLHADRLDAPELRRQLVRSRDALAQLTGAPPLSIAYPFGSYSAQTVEETGRAGYRFGLTTEKGSNRGVSPLELRRVAVRGCKLHHRWRFLRDLRREIAARKADIG